MITQDEKDMIAKLKELDKNAKKGPWYAFGTPCKDGKGKVYKVKPPEEDLIIAARNHIGDLIAIIERMELSC